MKWLIDGPIACFDVESTGTSVEQDRILTACTGLLKPGTPWTVDIQSYVINPGVDIPEEATAVHGLTNEFIKENGREPAEALDLIAHDLARTFLARIPIVVCNGVFDFTMVEQELRRHDLPTVEERLGRPIAPVVDVHVLDKHVDPYRKGSRTLDALRQHYGVRHDGAHDAITDALAAARVAYRIALLTQDTSSVWRLCGGQADRAARLARTDEVINRLVDLANVSAAQLHRLQIGWRAEQCDSLRAHFDRKGIEHDGVPGDWPMIPYATVEVGHA